MIARLRDRMSPEVMAQVYATPHDHARFGLGHHLRVETTIVLAKAFTQHWTVRARSVTDLSCGNGKIALSLDLPNVLLGDFAPGHAITGPIEETILTIPEGGTDVFVLSETLEHLDDPGWVLARIRERSRLLVLSTPLECWQDDNGEHYWAWDREGVEGLAKEAGWEPWGFASLDSRTFREPYLYGIWVFDHLNQNRALT